jgi:2-methylisocitrate lyase-like PEP mutase family enzyme
MSKPILRQKLDRKEFFVAPGIQDMITAVIAKDVGFDLVYATGYWMTASALGLPDAGIATYTEMLDRVGTLARTMPDAAIIADADTGYGGLLNVRYTVQGYEDAGVSAIQIEDQEFPKKCGHTPNRRVVPLEDMVRKIEVAVDSRKSDDFLIIARTDSRTGLGLDEAIKRGKAYRKAGADVVFIESPESEAEMRQVAQEIDAPLFANMVNGGRTPLLSADKLKELGYAIAIHPAVGFLAVGAALTSAYGDLLKNGETSPDIDLYSFAEFNKLLGFEDVWEFEQRFAQV